MFSASGHRIRLAICRIKIAFTENHQTLLTWFGQLVPRQAKRGFMKAYIGALAAVAATMTGEAQAASCWSDTAYQAAQLRDLDTMLMVATLRCRLKGNDFSADYNRFVINKRPILSAANIEMQAAFSQSVGKAKALGAYDGFMTKLANSYGNGTAGMNCADMAALTKMAADAPALRGTIVSLAEQAGSRPPIPALRCDTQVAINQK